MIISNRPSLCLLALVASVSLIGSVASIGVNYGTKGNNLPPPAQVAQFLKDKTTIDRVKIFDMNADIIKAFANTGILLSVTIPNGLIPQLADPNFAKKWVLDNIKSVYPATKINHILVGNEIIHQLVPDLTNNLVPAMKNIHAALIQNGMKDIKVTTAHSLGIVVNADPPSSCIFNPRFEQSVLRPMLTFHRETKTPFMVNPYPYFSYNEGNDSWILGRPNAVGHLDKATKINYMNVYDSLLDAVYTAMKKAGFGDVELAVGEVGWPSAGEPKQANVNNAKWHNTLILEKSVSGKGTPLMPGRKFETFIFALFNENLKEEWVAERNFGLFKPDFTPVYDLGIMRGQQGIHAKPIAKPAKPTAKPAKPTPAPATGKTWCVAKTITDQKKLLASIDWGCGAGGVDCKPINPGGPCYNGNDIKTRATYVMNAYYKSKGQQGGSCDFSGTAQVVHSDPSTASCKHA